MYLIVSFLQTAHVIEISLQADVMEETPAGASVLRVTASDADDGENARLTYSLISPAGFYIDPTSGLKQS